MLSVDFDDYEHEAGECLRGPYAHFTGPRWCGQDRKSTRLNSSHANISYAVFCLKKKQENNIHHKPHISNHSSKSKEDVLPEIDVDNEHSKNKINPSPLTIEKSASTAYQQNTSIA